ncbi:MAG: PAS domain S-box protein [Cyanobacteriota bacterium]|nr:PAS domain S-box protein [Cyanobacteriota bacterium]
MNKRSNSFLKTVAGSLGAATVLTLIVSAVSFWSALQTIEADRQTARELGILNNLESLKSSLKDTERLQQYYLLTGREDVFKSFNIKALSVEREMQKLQAIIDRNSQTETSAKQLEAFIDRRLQKLRQGIELRQTQGQESAIDRTPIPLLDEVTLLMQQIEAPETVELRKKRQASTNTSIRAMAMFLVSIVLNLAIILWTYHLIRRETLQRNQAEIELRQTLEILDLASDSIIIRNMEDRIIYWNKGAENLYGWKREEAEGKYIHTFLESTFPDSLDITLKQFLQQGYWEGEMRHQTQQGRSIVVASRWTLQRDSSGQPHAQLEINHNITARKQAEAQLSEMSERLSLALESGEIGCWEWDIVRNNLIWDERMYELYGVSKNSETRLAYDIWAEGLHPDDREASETLLHQTVLEKAEFDTEFRAIHPDGSIHHIKAFGLVRRDAEGNPTKMIGVNFDISDRKQAEIALEQSKEHLQAILDNSPAVIYVKNLQGRFTTVNHQFEKLFQLEKAEILGKGNFDLWERDIAEAFEANDRQVFATGRAMQWEELVPSEDGLRTYLSLKFPLLTVEGSPYAVCGISTDISDRKQAEMVLNQAKEAAEAANRTKSEFLANMNHELRTPLNGILGYAQILQRDPETTPKQQKGLGIIHQCGSHLLTLINDILDLSKLEVQKMELYPQDFHLANFLATTVEICRIKAEQKGIAFYYQPAENLPTAAYADDKRLRQVLLNLLSNAVKFTDFGSVTFSVEVVSHFSSIPDWAGNDQKPRTNDKGNCAAPPPTPFYKGARGSAHQLKSVDQGQMTNNQGQRTNDKPITRIRFQVEDTGIGISPNKLNTIFLPFEQAGKRDRNSEGTGLGLAISQQIVQMMGSTIEVNSTLNQGSTFGFEVDLPAAADWLSVPAATQQKIVGYRGKRYTILVIDDHRENRAVAVGMLEPLGFKTIEADDGQTGLDTALRMSPDLILTDVRMAEMDGLEMTRRLRELPGFARVPIIASPASLSQVERQDVMDAGCSSFFPKPIDFTGLLGELQRHLELQWIYETESETMDSSSAQPQESAVAVPPREELRELYQAAVDGFMGDIQKEARRLKQLDAEYSSFANTLLELSQRFDDEAILDFLKPHI